MRPRLYHSIGILTPYCKVMVAGSDVTNDRTAEVRGWGDRQAAVHGVPARVPVRVSTHSLPALPPARSSTRRPTCPRARGPASRRRQLSTMQVPT